MKDVEHLPVCAEEAKEPPMLSATIATILCSSSPLHAWVAHPKLNPDYVPEESKAFDVGKVRYEDIQRAAVMVPPAAG